ncbi:hypothetical protein [Lysinibacillus capsici]|uniref:hypothetical protein n=1 Tax=Lysinibacillus capsici TaxID=2115968 RepID=UPI002FDD9210
MGKQIIANRKKKKDMFFDKYGYDLTPEEFEKLFIQEYPEDWEKLWSHYKRVKEENKNKPSKKKKPLTHPKQSIRNIYNVRMKKHQQELYKQRKQSINDEE